MTNKEAFEAIRQLFSSTPEPAPAPAPEETPKPEEGKVEMSEYALEDGTKVMISALEVGGMVTLEDGTPAPMGEYKLADGMSVQVDETGTIIELASPKEDAAPEEAPAPAPAVDAQLKEELNATIESKLAEISAKFEAEKAELKAQIETLQGKVAQGFSQVTDLVESLAKEPMAEPTQKVQNSFNAHVNKKENKIEQVERFKKAILNNK